jgi:hypothetical protein
MKKQDKKKKELASSTRPPFRELRGYAFDPLTSLDLDTAEINQITYKVPWEDDLGEGPDGEYIKVIDYDPASNAVYAPVDLNDPNLLASDGLTPSETNPQFHQQMVYAVIMITIQNFEKALGRKVIWSPAPMVDPKQKKFGYSYVKQLYVYPHGLRDQNAYYDTERKALLFGYYNATPVDASLYLPGGVVYSCLSHDIVAHETTHALLDSLYPTYMEVTHPDLAGFHEGFADLVALLQHFTHPEIVVNQIRLVKGKLDMENLLVKLAVEFGQSTGEHKSLRSAIGGEDKKGNWVKITPKTTDYDNQLECHDRGALLVAAVFDAFEAIYKSRTADLMRIASGSNGKEPDGELHPDLVNRLADEAAKAAGHVLNMCVRALDYCPPVDLTYGDYLRALITADKELVNYDTHHYRIAFINAFRKRGIFPQGIPNLSVDTVCYNLEIDEKIQASFKKSYVLRQFKDKLAYVTDRKAIFDETNKFISGDEDSEGNVANSFHEALLSDLMKIPNGQLENLTGLVFSREYKKLGIRSSKTRTNQPAVWIQSMRLNNRIGPDGTALNQLIVTLIQTAKVVVVDKSDEERVVEPSSSKAEHRGLERFNFRGACTLIFDLDELKLKHAITKPIFDQDSAGPGKKRKLLLNQSRALLQYDSTNGELAEKIGIAAEGREPEEFLAHIHNNSSSFTL